jgi:hypothetical protein
LTFSAEIGLEYVGYREIRLRTSVEDTYVVNVRGIGHALDR